MSAQTNYNYSTPKGVPGGKFDIAFDEVITRRNESNDGVMKFGMAVAQGTTAGKTVKVPASTDTADKIEGVAIALPNTEQDMAGNVIVKKDVSLSVMRKGNIWGRLADENAPTAGATAYVIQTGDNAGEFTASADNGEEGNDKVEYLNIGAKFGNACDLDAGIAVIVL